RGMLTVSGPHEGLTRTEAQREVLDRHAIVAGRALLLALERTNLAGRVRLADTARDVVRQASQALSLRDAIDEARGPLVEAFDLSGLSVWLNDDPTIPDRVDPDFYSAVQQTMAVLWRAHRPRVIGSSLYTPIGAGERVLGSLVLTRSEASR